MCFSHPLSIAVLPPWLAAAREKTIAYLRRQLAECPNGELAEKGAHHLDRALNQTSPRS